MTVNFAGRSLTKVTASGSDADAPDPWALTVRFVVPIRASLGTSRRNSKETFALVAGITAAIGWPPPSSVAVHPCGTPETDSDSRSGGSA